MLMRSRRALRSRREWSEEFKIEADDAPIDCPSGARTLPSHEAALLCSQQDHDDSDGGVIVDCEKSKTYVGLDMVKVEGKNGREKVRSYSGRLSRGRWEQ